MHLELMTVYGGIENLEATPNIQLLGCYVLNGGTASYFPVIQLSLHSLERLNHWRSMDRSLPRFDLTMFQNKTLADLQQHVREFVELVNRIANMGDRYSSATLSIVRKTLLPRHFFVESKLLRRVSVSANDSHHLGGLGPKGHHRISCLLTIVCQILRYCDANDLQAVKTVPREDATLSPFDLEIIAFLFAIRRHQRQDTLGQGKLGKC